MSGAVAEIGDVARRLRRLAGDRASAARAADLVAGMVRGRIALRGARRLGHVYVGGPMTIVTDGEMTIGRGALLFGGMIRSELVCHAGARLSIGDGCELNYGVSIEAWNAVRIGDRCKIGSMVRVADGGRGEAAPVVIGDDVWLAHGAIVEPGVTIGDGSVVSAGSVVTTSIPAGSLAIGNPARAVRLETLAGAPRR